MSNLAPVVLFTYNRLDHVISVINSLMNSVLSNETDLIIFSDGPKSDLDLPNVMLVRNYLKKVSGFKSVKIIFRSHNYGLAKSIISGLNDIFLNYDKAIVLEDDIVVSRGFLIFMNNALDFYYRDYRIMSISGFKYPVNIDSSYKDEIFLFYRGSSWGWATWRDRWLLVDFNLSDYNDFVSSKKLQSNFKRGGEDLLPLLKLQVQGKVNSWAIRFAYAHYKHDMLALFPVTSMTANIGHDGSGTHCANSTIYDVNLPNNWSPSLTRVELNKDIVLSMQEFFAVSMYRKIKRRLKKIIRAFLSNE